MATINPVWRVWEHPSSAAAYGTGAAPTQAFNSAWLNATITWVNVASTDTATPAPCGWLSDKSIQFSGTVTSAAVNGSNDPAIAYVPLNDPQGNPLTGVAAAKIEQLLENTLMVQPVTTTGTVTYTLFGRIPKD